MRITLRAIAVAFLVALPMVVQAAILGYIDFESYAPGTTFGSPTLPVGSTAFTQDGVAFKAQSFVPAGASSSSYGRARIEAPPAASQMLELDNIVLSVDFSGLKVTEVTMEYQDKVGDKSLQVNGATLHTAKRLRDLPAAVAPDVTYSFTEVGLPGGPSHGSRGRITLKGPITRLDFGGQEFLVDNIVWRSEQ